MARFKHYFRLANVAVTIAVLIFGFAGIVFAEMPQWEADARLTFDPEFSSTSLNNATCVAAGLTGAGEEALHLIFFDDRDGNREIYYKRSIDGGTSWSGDVRLTNNAAISHFAAIAAAGQAVHVVWEEYRDGNAEIYYKRSTDAGASWGADTRLTTNAANSFSPSVAVSGGVVHVTWFDQRDGNNEIYYKRSIDGGSTWSPDIRLTNNSSSSIYSAVAAVGDLVHVVWEEHRDGNGEVYYKRSTDGGASWSADTRLTNNAANSFSPSVAAAGSDVNVAWFDQRDANLEIYDKHSANEGLNWGADKRITNNAAVSNYPSVVVAGASVHLVWFDERDGNTEIYYNQSADRGATWGSDVRLTNDTARSTDPSVVVSGSSVHVAWTDARDNGPTYNRNYEIYYKRTEAPIGVVSGTVTYGNDITGPPPRPVSNVTFSATGPSNLFTSTVFPSGDYSLSGFLVPGTYVVSPSKTDVNGITSFDAAKVAQHVAGVNILTGAQLTVADASGSGGVTSFDAALIARYVIGQPDSGLTGRWVFQPPNRIYSDITTNITGQDYTALLMGEVSGNWTNSGARPFHSRPYAANGGPEGIAVELPNLRSSVGRNIVIPVNARGLAKKNVISYEFELKYNPNVLQPFVDVAHLNGTASRGLSVVTNVTEPGLVRVVVYGPMPIQHDGVLLNLRFTTVGSAGSISPLVLERIMLNEGEPIVTTEGRVKLF